MQSLEPGFVGIRGKLGEEIFDKYLSQFNQNLARQDRIMARELVRVTAMTALRKISGDNTGRWTTQDKQVAEDAITDLSMGQSYSMIAGKLEVLKQSARDRGKQLAEKLKQPQPLWTYSDQELAAALDAKKITRDQFVQEYVSRYGPLEQQKSVTPAQ
jgi:hypothetical protein